MKQMIQGLHDNGLRAVMDVVYNHMFDAKASNLDKIVRVTITATQRVAI